METLPTTGLLTKAAVGRGSLDPRVARSRAAILEAASDLIVERGFRECTIDAIVERTGIARTTLYRHWPSRAALLEQTLDHIGQSRPLPDTGSLGGDLLELFETRAPNMMTSPERPGRSLPSLLEITHKDPGLAHLTGKILQSIEHSFRTLIERARARGEIRQDLDIEAMVNMLMGASIDRRNLPEQRATKAYIGDAIAILTRGARP